MRWHTYVPVSDVTPDRIFDQLSQQAPQDIQAECLADMHAFTGGAFQANNRLSSFWKNEAGTVQQPTREVKENPVSLDGLEEVFDVDSTVTNEVDQGDSTVPSKKIVGLTIREASLHYNLAIPTIRLKIKTGDIPATKVNGPKGPEWRVFPSGLPQSAEPIDISLTDPTDQADSPQSEGSHQTDRTIAEGFHQANINVASLIKANQELSAKLEAVVYRNGYLEAQVESERQQIKLLTDQLHKPDAPAELGWWSRFCSWFKV